MKQFQYVSGRIGSTFGPYTEAEVQAMTSLVHDALTLDPGQTWTDYEDDVWSRADGAAIPDERLERITTPVFAAMINASPMLSADVLATTAVDFAKALIAELDKQA